MKTSALDKALAKSKKEKTHFVICRLPETQWKKLCRVRERVRKTRPAVGCATLISIAVDKMLKDVS
jgi:hypothetical protein